MTRRFINALQVELPEDPGGADGALGTRGLVAEPFNPAAVANTGFAPITTLMYANLVFIQAGSTVVNMVVGVTTAAVGTPPTLIKLGVYSAGGVLQAQTANVASDAMWTSVGQKVVPLTAPWTTAGGGSFYLVFLKSGTFASTDVQL